MSNYNNYNQELLAAAFAKASVPSTPEWLANMEEIGEIMQDGAYLMAKRMQKQAEQIEENVRFIKQQEAGQLAQQNQVLGNDDVEVITKVDGNISVSKYTDGLYKITNERRNMSGPCYQLKIMYSGIKASNRIYFVPDLGVRILNSRFIDAIEINEIHQGEHKIMINYHGYKFVLEDGKEPIVIDMKTTDAVHCTWMTIEEWFNNDLAN